MISSTNSTNSNSINSNSKTCIYIITKGKNQGKKCNLPVKGKLNYCSKCCEKKVVKQLLAKDRKLKERLSTEKLAKQLQMPKGGCKHVLKSGKMCCFPIVNNKNYCDKCFSKVGVQQKLAGIRPHRRTELELLTS